MKFKKEEFHNKRMNEKINSIFILCLLLFVASSVYPIFIDLSEIKSYNLRNIIRSIVIEENEKLERLWGFRVYKNLKVKISHFEYRGECISRGKEYVIFINPEFTNYRNTIKHELMHLYNFEWEKKKNISTPLWIVEGLAMLWENQLERRSIPSLETLVYLWKSDILKMEDYPDELEQYYDAVHLFMLYLDGKLNIFEKFDWLLKEVEKEGSWEKAISDIFSKDIERIYSNFKLKESFIFLLNPNIVFYIMGLIFLIIIPVRILQIIKKRRMLEEMEDENEGNNL